MAHMFVRMHSYMSVHVVRFFYYLFLIHMSLHNCARSRAEIDNEAHHEHEEQKHMVHGAIYSNINSY